MKNSTTSNAVNVQKSITFKATFATLQKEMPENTALATFIESVDRKTMSHFISPADMYQTKVEMYEAFIAEQNYNFDLVKSTMYKELFKKLSITNPENTGIDKFIESVDSKTMSHFVSPADMYQTKVEMYEAFLA